MHPSGYCFNCFFIYDADCNTCMFRDKSIPELSATMSEYQDEINQLSSLVTSQVEFEQAAHESRARNAQHALPCREPRYL